MNKNDNNMFNKRQKGFYLMLLLCVLVVGVTLAVVTTRNTDNQENLAENESIDLNEPVDKNINNNHQLVKADEEKKNIDDKKVESNNNIKKEDIQVEPKQDKEKTDVKVEPKQEQKQTNKQETNKQEKQEKQENKQEDKVAQVTNMNGGKIEENIQKDKKLSYDSKEKMLWPVEGEVVMAFNVDSPIYDATLDQFRTNDQISIKTEENEQVKSAAAGVVEKVVESTNGNSSVVIDHGNGYKTTYGQLQKNVPVKEKQKISKGEVIGKSASPSKYSISMGNHVDFKVTKNGQPVNPEDLLK